MFKNKYSEQVLNIYMCLVEACLDFSKWYLGRTTGRQTSGG